MKLLTDKEKIEILQQQVDELTKENRQLAQSNAELQQTLSWERYKSSHQVFSINKQKQVEENVIFSLQERGILGGRVTRF